MTVLLILSFAISMIAVPSASAQTERKTFPFVDAVPKTVGVGQASLINFGLLNQLNTDGDGWNVTLVVTDPDGKVEKFDRMTWSTGTVGMHYTPTKEGNYTLQCLFENVTYRSTRYASSESENATLTALIDWYKPWYPGHNLPQEYWSRPVDSQLREWGRIMGSWVQPPSAVTGTGLYTMARFNEGPESAHILWSRPVGDTMGGVAGGTYYTDNAGNEVADGIAYQNGDAYEGKFAGSVVIAGVLYYNKYTSAGNNQTVVAVELSTGKTLWEKSFNFGSSGANRINRGQVLTWLCLNNRGVFSYLWFVSGTTMYAVDPKTGDWKYTMTNVPAGTIYVGENGEMLKYQAVNIGTTASPVWQLRQWNSSFVVTQGKVGMAESWGSQIQGQTYNATERGYDHNMTISGITSLPGQTTTGNNANQTVTPIVAFPGDMVVFGSASVTSGNGVTLTGISLNEENPGYVMYSNRNWAAPADWEGLSGSQTMWVCYSEEEHVAVYWVKETTTNYVFDLNTGKFMWQSEPQIFADAWTDSPSYERAIAYGKLYTASVGGIVYCYDIKTGNIVWTYEAKDPYIGESYLGENWWLIMTFITDGKVYFGHMEHSAQEPKPRGAPFLCLDAETGDLIWEIDGAFRQTRWGGRALIGDSIMVTMDTYDSQIYAIGKGPSSMTISAPDVAVAAGTPFVIRGTVMDISPGTQSDILQMRFANGVPAVSDESMSEWMLYIYKNFERPNDVKGVAIDIWAFGPNGEEIHIGETVSDASGKFAYTYAPDAAGDYEIFAYFMGSKSYYGSFAKTDMTVMAAPEQIIQETPPYEWYIVGMGIAIIAVVLVVGLLNKKK